MKINSQEENEFVLNLVNKLAPSLKQIWIGLEWDSQLKAFVWYDHSVPTFTKWSPNEPNGNGVEPCSNMWTGVVIGAQEGPNQSQRSKIFLDQSESSIQPM